MCSQDAQRVQPAAFPAVLFSAWIARAKPGEWLEYCRDLLAPNRILGTSSLNKPERRKLATVADHALPLADQSKLHLLQEHYRDGDCSYWAVARAPARPSRQVLSRFSIDRRSERRRS